MHVKHLFVYLKSLVGGKNVPFVFLSNYRIKIAFIMMVRKIHCSLIHHILVEINSHFGFTPVKDKAHTQREVFSLSHNRCEQMEDNYKGQIYLQRP